MIAFFSDFQARVITTLTFTKKNINTNLSKTFLYTFTCFKLVCNFELDSEKSLTKPGRICGGRDGGIIQNFII